MLLKFGLSTTGEEESFLLATGKFPSFCCGVDVFFRISEFLDQDVRLPFNLATKTATRFTLIRTSLSECVFVWTHHHILLDGWSAAIVVSEVNSLYANEVHSLHLPYLAKPN